MMKFLGHLLLFLMGLLVLAVFLIWLVIFKPYKLDYHWNYKLVLNVDTPTGIQSGNTVIGVRSQFGVGPKGSGYSDGEVGEALVLEMPDTEKTHHLFLLLDGISVARVYEKELLEKGGPVKDSQGATPIKRLDFWNDSWRRLVDGLQNHPPKEVQRKYYPRLVTFTDINDPKTVMRIDPDDMDAVLGCSKPQLAKDFPWRAQGRTWRQWYKFEAFREAILNAGEEAGLPADYSRYAALEKLNGAFNNGIANETEPRYMPPPKGYEADKLQLASMWSAIRAKYGKSSLNEMYRQHRVAAAKLRKTYLERGRDTTNDCHRLKSLTLEITDEPVTMGQVEKVLGWFGTYRTNHYRMNGKKCVACPIDRTFAAKIGTGNFKVGN